MTKFIDKDRQEHYHYDLVPNEPNRMTTAVFYDLWAPAIEYERQGGDRSPDGSPAFVPTRPRPTFMPSRSPLDLPIALAPWVHGKKVFHIGVCSGNLMPSWLIAGAESITGLEINGESIFNLVELFAYYAEKEKDPFGHFFRDLEFTKRAKFGIGNVWFMWADPKPGGGVVWHDEEIPKIVTPKALTFNHQIIQENIERVWLPYYNHEHCGGNAHDMKKDWEDSDIIFCWSLRGNRATEEQMSALQKALDLSDEDMTSLGVIDALDNPNESNPSAIDGFYLAQKIREQTDKPKILVRMHALSEEEARFEGDDVVSFNSVECQEYPETPWFAWPDDQKRGYQSDRGWIEGKPIWLSLKYINFTEEIWKEKYPHLAVPKCLRRSNED